MTFKVKKNLFPILILSLFIFPGGVFAQNANVNANHLLAHVGISLSPSVGSFVEGSTFQMPILINTEDRSINGVEVRINFDKNKLEIVNPTGGTSIIGVWVEPPGFDNTKGTASYVGVLPVGITTQAGLIGTITFRAKIPGNAVVSVASNSKVLLNDGLGTEALLDLGRAQYTILVKAPEGVQVFSDTHSVQGNWHNNNTPTLFWVHDPGVTGFSFVLDNKPNTIPDNKIITTDTTKSFEKLSDGLWYFHIKANKNGVWGVTGHFLIRIDTTPPAKLKPEVNYLVSAVALVDRILVSFFTTDNLSGIDHYEVGIIDKNQPPTQSPVFVQTESPFQVPLNAGDELAVIVRAIDKAGNVQDESIDVEAPFAITKFVQDYLFYILFAIILLGFVILIIHYMIGHHIIRYLHQFRSFINKEEKLETENSVQQNSGYPIQKENPPH